MSTALAKTTFLLLVFLLLVYTVEYWPPADRDKCVFVFKFFPELPHPLGCDRLSAWRTAAPKHRHRDCLWNNYFTYTILYQFDSGVQQLLNTIIGICSYLQTLQSGFVHENNLLKLLNYSQSAAKHTAAPDHSHRHRDFVKKMFLKILLNICTYFKVCGVIRICSEKIENSNL